MAKRFAEIERRIGAQEQAIRNAWNGAAAAQNINGGNPSLLAPGVYGPLLSAGPIVRFYVPNTGAVAFGMYMQSDLTVPISATNVAGRNEAAVELSGNNVRACQPNEALWHACSGAPSTVQEYQGIGVSRVVLLTGLAEGPTTFQMKFRSDKVGVGVGAFVSGIVLTVTAA